jgi:hypothetical protein
MSPKHEAAAQADCAKGINAISVLEDFCFDGRRGDFGRKTVSLNSVVDGLEVFLWISMLPEDDDGVIGCELRSARSFGGILGNMDAVMKPGSGQKNFHREILGCGNFFCIKNNSADVF